MPKCQFLKNKYSRNWKRNLFYEVLHRKTPEARRGHLGGLVGPHHPQARLGPCPRLGGVWPTSWPPGSALPPIYSPRRENPRYCAKVPERSPPPPPSRSQVSGD